MLVWGIILRIMTIVLQRYIILIGMDLTKAALVMVSDNIAQSSSILNIQYKYSLMHTSVLSFNLLSGNQPYYMLSNPDYFFSSSIEECCDKFYEWNYFSCTGTKPELTNGEYYPDWTGSSTATCLNDDKMPTYMLNDQGWYLSTTLEKCCERHFFWGLKECLGTSDVGSNDWYVKYEDETCVQDCNGASPCGGVADSWVELYKSKEMCCEDRLPWKPRCRFY